ncbi:hypothetical protein ACMU_03070 [Actibacterium mucosum KCTC 23349]|uniref:Uncharacterized protein n=2 Tax=Actibacterium TaxID=1433986 RepID=A0A037ZPP3_9RHOB|nr:hypothetical protein ACMU_03070 [Actibacterium mucosum KCTC 23349]
MFVCQFSSSMGWFRLKALAVAIAMLPGFAHANCAERPTWRGQPITQEYIDTQEDPVVRAHLEIARYWAGFSVDRQKSLKRKLMPPAIYSHEGDKGEFRKKLVAGTLLDVVDAIDFGSEPHRFRHEGIEAYWLNGCVDEAIQVLMGGPGASADQYQIPIATSSADLMYELADRFEDDASRQQKLTVARLLEKPDAAEEILRAYLGYIEANTDKSDLEDHVERSAIRTALSLFSDGPLVLDRPELPHQPSQHDVQAYYRSWNLIVGWSLLAGHCDAFETAKSELLVFPDSTIWSFDEFLAAAAIRCIVLTNG